MFEEYHINDDFKSSWRKKLLNWYSFNKRDLPWRRKENQNFYRIWISEVMLQQTSVNTVIPYYNEFIKRWPNLESFFSASLDEILYLWQGLGYYQRAKNLFRAKEFLKKKEITINSDNLKKLPGIGEYISSAISAILCDESCAVIDGNIKRILSRAFNINHLTPFFNKKISFIAEKLTPPKNNKLYCQSLMDLANLICKPKIPLCNSCPINNQCLNKNKLIKTKKIKVKRLEKKMKVGAIFFIRYSDEFLVEKSKKRLLEGMSSFPVTDFVELLKGQKKLVIQEKLIKNWLRFYNLRSLFKFNQEIDHEFSHFHLKLLIVEIKLKERASFKNFVWQDLKKFEGRAISKLMEKVKYKVL